MDKIIFYGAKASAVGKSFNGKTQGNDTPVRRRGTRKQDPFWAVLNSVRRHLNNRLYGGVLSKSEVAARVLNEAGYSEKEFFHEYAQKVTRLLNDSQFLNDCSELKLDPAIAAQHVVFSGKTKYMLAREKRLNDVFINGKIASMQEPIFRIGTKPLALPPVSESETFGLTNNRITVAEMR